MCNCASREWELLKRFSMSEVEGQHHSYDKCTIPDEEYSSIDLRLLTRTSRDAYEHLFS